MLVQGFAINSKSLYSTMASASMLYGASNKPPVGAEYVFVLDIIGAAGQYMYHPKEKIHVGCTT